MPRNNPTGTSVKFPPGLIDMMDREIETHGIFRNRSELITQAVREYLLNLQKIRNETKEEDFIASSRGLQSDLDIKTK